MLAMRQDWNKAQLAGIHPGGFGGIAETLPNLPATIKKDKHAIRGLSQQIEPDGESIRIDLVRRMQCSKQTFSGRQTKNVASSRRHVKCCISTGEKGSRQTQAGFGKMDTNRVRQGHPISQNIVDPRSSGGRHECQPGNL